MVQEPVALLEYAKQQKFLLDEAAAWTGRLHAKPGAVRPDSGPADSMQGSRPEQAWAQAFRATHDAWLDPVQHRQFHEVIERYRWKKNRKDESVCRAMIDALDANDPDLLSLKDAGYFCANVAGQSASSGRTRRRTYRCSPASSGWAMRQWSSASPG